VVGVTRRRKVAAGILGAVFLAQGAIWALEMAHGAGHDSTPTGMGVDVPKLTEPITTATAQRLAWCVTEDYTASPCYWDASRRGNRIGMSFWVGSDGCRHYFAAADEARYGDKISPCLDPS
jgi:hypothetical protein